MSTTGYELMRDYYENYHDGLTWHNYWLFGRSQYGDCLQGGGHVSYHFPDWLLETIDPVIRPAFILEADIASPTQASAHVNNPILADKDGHVAGTSASIHSFFQYEYCQGGGTKYLAPVRLASWLLYDNTATPEHHWHMAYGTADPATGHPDTAERAWFPIWWGDEETLFACPHTIPET